MLWCTIIFLSDISYDSCVNDCSYDRDSETVQNSYDSNKMMKIINEINLECDNGKVT